MDTDHQSLFNFDDLPAFRHAADGPAPQVAFKRLSTLLKSVPANECHLILEQFTAALLDGHVKAVPFLGRRFSKVIVDQHGRKIRKVVQDELIEIDETFLAWMGAQRKAARYQVLLHVGNIGTTEERLARGEDDFHALLQARLSRLQAEQPRKRQRT